MKVFATPQDLQAVVGQEIGTSDWLTVTQEHIDLFAQATGDHQWIHVDPVRAAAGPYGTTIAHGFLTLSLVPRLFTLSVKVEQVRMGVNYGVNKVRFPAPVPSGSRLRARLKLLSCEPVPDDGVQTVWEMQMEREGGTKPVCVAEVVQRLYR